MERKALYAGSWYPADRQALGELIGRAESHGESVMAVLPHAGLFYSAPLIRGFFENLDEKIRRVIIIAPSHYYALAEDQLVYSDFTLSETPLGNVDTIPLEAEGAYLSDKAIEREHALEMFLPFIKNKELAVSYLLLSHLSSRENIARLADRIEPFIKEDTALIASSDFTHYGKRFGYTPFGQKADERVKEHDLSCAALLRDGRTAEAYKYIDSTICGIAPALVVSEIARRKGLKGNITGSYTSNEVTGELAEDFVSYVAIQWRKV